MPPSNDSDDALVVEGVSKYFGGLAAVKRVNCYFFPGEINALIGPNGAGKTTLFQLLTGGLKPDEGDIKYKGNTLVGSSPWQTARLGIGRLFQDVRVFEEMTVYNNVAVAAQSPSEEHFWRPFARIPAPPDRNRSVSDLLELVGLADLSGEKAGNLSFGQQKLLAITRLVAGNFDVLLLDEPTSGVHPKMISTILDLLRSLVGRFGKTLIVIEHNMSVIVEIADWVFFMNDGEIKYFGDPDHVLGAEPVRRTYLGL